MSSVNQYIQLARLDKPIGIFLLLWPTLWALWLAHPQSNIIGIFILGTLIMRSAGCIINDIADRKLDPHVTRTAIRPLANQSISLKEAYVFLFILLISAVSLAFFTLNFLAFQFALLGGLCAFIYPFLKRITFLPQVGLGVTFACSVPIAFAAELNTIPVSCWIVFSAAVLWPIIYDTYYAMVDREDDLKIGIKSTAILFGHYDLLIIKLMKILFLVLMIFVGKIFNLHASYYVSIVIVVFLFLYQQWITRNRDPKACFKAFLNNQWVGLILFLGIVLS